jgi:CubicO group peptidase (beta-lactamase class C family)
MPRRILILLCLAALLWPAAAHAQEGAGALDTAAIDAYVTRQMREDRVPGVALAIVHDRRLVYLRGYGEDGRGHPVRPETGFVLGSMSKSFTALAVMQLVERGAVELDAPAQRYLPAFRVADRDASARITVRHLLNHTSGIPTRAPQAGNSDATLQDHVRALAGVELAHPPGTRHAYASPNYLVLGALVEEVSGQSFGAYLQEQVFDPLQMRHSSASAAGAGADYVARGHRYWFGLPVPADLPYEADRVPTAAVISSAEDLAHYLIAHLNGGRFGEAALLSPAGMVELQRPGAAGDGFSYAMGWRVGPIHGVPAVHHGGIVPHFRGKLVLLPEQRWGVAVLTNASTSLPLPITPTSHHLADGLAAYLTGGQLPGRAYSQGLISLVVSAGLALVLLNQLGDLARLDRWRARAAGRARSAWVDVAAELLWPAAAAVALPLLVGLPWSELARGAPDMALWLLVSGALSLFAALAKGAALYGVGKTRYATGTASTSQTPFSER